MFIFILMISLPLVVWNAENKKVCSNLNTNKIINITEVCVGDIAELLGMSQPQVSHHLRMLRNLKLVKKRKDGRTSYYSLDDEHIECILKSGIEHVEDLVI